MAKLLFDDGYTLSHKIKASGPWPEVNARYRPALPEAVFDFLQAKRESGKQSAKLLADFVYKHLVSWDVTDTKDESVTITPDVLRRIPHPILRELGDVVMGYSTEAQEEDVKI
jgi:hypothetical protein